MVSGMESADKVNPEICGERWQGAGLYWKMEIYEHGELESYMIIFLVRAVVLSYNPRSL